MEVGRLPIIASRFFTVHGVSPDVKLNLILTRFRRVYTLSPDLGFI